MDIESLGKMILVIGLVMFLIGGVLVIGGKIGLGRLPGDIFIKKGNFTFYFPLITCILVSIILTLFVNFILRR